ncbi:MAG: TlpA disulfide reductase family protein [Pseudomonadota bacterium]
MRLSRMSALLIGAIGLSAVVGCDSSKSSQPVATTEIGSSNETLVDSQPSVPESQEYSLTFETANFPDGTNISVYTLAHADSPAAVDYVHDDTLLISPRMTFSGEVSEAALASVRITPPRESGVPYMDFMFMLEPGALTVTLDEHERLIRTGGGRYNEIVFDSWRERDDYAAASSGYRSELSRINEDIAQFWSANPEAESLPEDILTQYSQADDEVQRIQNEQLSTLFETTNDPVVKLAAVVLRRDLELGEKLTLLQTLEAEMANSRAWDIAFSRAARALESQAADASIGIGSMIKDFSANHFEGGEFHLSDVLGTKRYVLVEFWASWCGPCRAEIPHMKSAYARYENDGFEIVSFSLDHEMEAWEDASWDEELPWINTGDLLAYTSPVARAYGVIGIPKNYLIDGSSGEILYADLRGEELDATLSDLFGK